MSILETQLKQIVAQAFHGQLLNGTLRREVVTGLDAKGDPTAPVISTHSFEGIRDTFDAAYAARAGIPTTDVRILIIAGSCNTDPQQDDKIFIRNRWHQVRRITAVDPANATFTLQAYEINAP